jgi:hypothetical protein
MDHSAIGLRSKLSVMVWESDLDQDLYSKAFLSSLSFLEKSARPPWYGRAHFWFADTLLNLPAKLRQAL